MTREEAKERYSGIPIVFKILDEIYDEFDIKDCKNCKYHRDRYNSMKSKIKKVSSNSKIKDSKIKSLKNDIARLQSALGKRNDVILSMGKDK